MYRETRGRKEFAFVKKEKGGGAVGVFARRKSQMAREEV